MKKRVFYFIGIVLLSIFTKEVKADTITFTADYMTGTAGNQSDTACLSGNAEVKTGNIEIHADSITMKGTNFRYIEAEGNITIKNTDSDINFSCNSLIYDRELKVASLRNNIELTDNKNNVSAKAQMIEYNQNTEIIIMQVDIKLTQKDNICTGAFALYDKNQQILQLNGTPKIEQGKDIYKAQQITLNLETQEIELDGKVNGTVNNESKTDTEDKNNQMIENEVISENVES